MSGSRVRTSARTIIAIAAGRTVSAVLRVLASRSARLIAVRAAVCVGVALQVGLCLVAMYLIDLSISLFDLWTELARKHLELTL